MNQAHRTSWQLISVGIALTIASTIGACSSSGPKAPANDHLIAVDPDQADRMRSQALDRLWQRAMADGSDETIDSARETLKAVAWDRSIEGGGAGGALRVQAIELLATDPRDAGQADTAEMAGLLVATELNWDVIRAICQLTQEHNWQQAVPGLVRSYSRPVADPPDQARAEKTAIEAVSNGKTAAQVAVEVFAMPENAFGWPKQLVLAAKTDAWELLNRLDTDGSIRTRILIDMTDQEVGSDPVVRAARRVANDFGLIPRTGSELRWALRLVDEAESARSDGWWSQAMHAVDQLSTEQRDGLRLRHLEAIRWAATHRPEWIAMDTSSLHAELASRLAQREHIRRTPENLRTLLPREETLEQWGDQMAWPDLLSVLTLDEALKSHRVRDVLLAQGVRDRADDTAEYGGVIRFDTQGDPLAAEYVPRPAQREGDEKFVAPVTMFDRENDALAHYHFHAQKYRNSEYAGPGGGDLAYADEHQRHCVVFTWIDQGVLNADYYQPGEIVIDLGMIESERR